jgi:hypothetical protein
MLQRIMTAYSPAFAELSDDQLLAEVHRLAGAERDATAALIRSLMELDSTRRSQACLESDSVAGRTDARLSAAGLASPRTNSSLHCGCEGSFG